MLKTKADSVCCPPLARHGVNLCYCEHYPKRCRPFCCFFRFCSACQGKNSVRRVTAGRQVRYVPGASAIRPQNRPT